MSLIQFPVRGLVAAVLCLVTLGAPAPFRADKPSDPFKAGTVWKGECVYDKTDYFPESEPYPMVLYVKQRKGAEFEAVTWYPTRENGLLKVTGRVGAKGDITFLEAEVIHGRATRKRNTGVLAGMRFTGRLDRATIKGSGDWTGPAFNGPIRAKFSLKLAE